MYDIIILNIAKIYFHLNLEKITVAIISIYW